MAKAQTRPTLAELVREHTSSQGPKCPVGLVLRDHPDDADEVQAILDDKAAQHTAIAKALEVYFRTKVNEQAIAKHRNKRCACFTAPYRGSAA
jgi:hypothetical protein